MNPAESRLGCSARRHGDASAYTYFACRCADAREDHRVRSKRRRQGRAEPLLVNAIGTARRLQALAALGWGLAELQERLGVTKGRIQYLQVMGSPMVRRGTAEAVARLYDALSMTPGSSPQSERTKRNAKRQGWVPPLAWDDDEIDNPDACPAAGLRRWTTPANAERIAAALAGDDQARRALTGADRQRIVRQLHGEGLLDPEICARSGLSRRAVQYLRGQLCLPSNAERDVKARAG